MPRTPVSIRKSCPLCEKQFFTNRARAIYCCNACKTAAYRSKLGNPHKQEPHYKICQNPKCGKPIELSGRADIKYCRPACRKAVYNQQIADLASMIKMEIA